MNLNKLARLGLVLLTGVALSGCVVSQGDVKKMNPAEAYYCAVDGGANYALGLWYKNDTHGLCRERVRQLEKSGEMLDTDKHQALRAGAGL